MRLNALLERLDGRSLGETHFADAEAEVYNISFLTPSACDLREDVLYFGSVSLLPPCMPGERVFSCVAYGEGELPEHLLDHHNVNIARVAPGADPFACFNRLQQFFIEDTELTDVIRRMLTALLSNNGLQYLVEEASAALGNPILVVDASMHYIAQSVDLTPDDTSAFADVMRQELTYSSILEGGAAYLRSSGIDEELARTRKPVLGYNDHLGCITMTGAVLVRGICIAHVLMAGVRHPFGSLDEEAFARLVLFVGQELQKQPLYAASGDQAAAYFLEGLLEDDQPSSAVVQRRLKVLDFRPLPVRYVVVFSSTERRLTPHDTEGVAGQLVGVLAHSVHVCHEGELVILLTRPEGEDLEAGALEVFGRVARLNHLACGISNPFDDLVDIRRYLAQARVAVRCGSRLAYALDDHSVYRYRDFAYVDLLDVANRSLPLLDLCDPKLLELVRQDEARHTDLAETLFEYLQSAQSTTRAAKLLSLHKNTLLYRLNNIRDRLGCDLSSGEDIFRLQLSFRVLMHLGLFRSRLHVGRDELSRTPAAERGKV